jgi:glycosyltransferase involved in cell wall biosynthesis
MKTPDDAQAPVDDGAVSVIMPILNEERHLRDAVTVVLDQDYPGELELVLALGPSKDRTDQVAHALAEHDPRITLVRNPSGRTPDALNAAIAASRYDVIARVDGHALIPRDYLSIAVEVLRRTGADNVGGIMDAQGTTTFEKAVAAAMRSRLGVGNSRFHTGGQEGPAETVYLGVFRRSALDRVGGYDAHFARAQDWELNHRIRTTGGLVWFTPDLTVRYRPRASVSALARQYFHYGRWRRVVARTHGTISARYLAPPALVCGLGAALLIAPWWPWTLLAPVGYLLAIAGGGMVIGTGLGWRERVRVPVALGVMHLSWGVGFLTSPARLRHPDGAVVTSPEAAH